MIFNGATEAIERRVRQDRQASRPLRGRAGRIRPVPPRETHDDREAVEDLGAKAVHSRKGCQHRTRFLPDRDAGRSAEEGVGQPPDRGPGGRSAGGGIPTFAEAADKVIAIHRESWRPGGKSEAQWRASLRTYAFPHLGTKRVDRITTSDVLAVLVPIWSSKRETARRVRQRVGSIMKWAVAEGYREDNPAGDAIGAALPRHGKMTRHFPALPHSQVAAALATVQASGAWIGTKLAFEFLVLTAARSGEVRNSRWQEIDIEGSTWTVPGERMKAGRDHRVPLSRPALAVLGEAHEIAGRPGLIFPAPTGRVLSAMTMTKLVRELGIEAVPHGFRSSFRDWAAEMTDHPREVIEAALAHVVRNKVEAAYRRTDLFERRRRLMEDWASYVVRSS